MEKSTWGPSKEDFVVWLEETRPETFSDLWAEFEVFTGWDDASDDEEEEDPDAPRGEWVDGYLHLHPGA